MLHHNYKKFFDIKKILEDIKFYIPNFNKERFMKAFYFAENAHKDQMRKDKVTPYFVHPVLIVEILIKYHADEDILITALLHDVPEDTEHTVEEVAKLFGEDVAFLVDGITKLSAVQYKGGMSARKIGTLKKMIVHSAKDPRVVLVKLADRLHNMRTLVNVPQKEKRDRIARETIELFVPMANLLGIQEIKTELEDLCFMHLFPKEYANLKKIVDEKMSKSQSSINKFKKIIKSTLLENNIDSQTVTRNKGVYSVFKKVHTENFAVDGRASLILIVNTIPECYAALGIIHSIFTPHTKRFKDYIANPKINKYQSLHTSVFGVNGLYTELQIRTKEMHLNALYGITSYFFTEQNSKNMLKDIRSSWFKKILKDNEYMEGDHNFIKNLKSDLFNERIFVFSRDGKRFNLPAGASCIDLAYLIDERVGKHAVSALINRKKMPIITALNTGDTVVIKTDKNCHPILTWMTFVRTSKARIAILGELRKQPKSIKLFNGKNLLQKEFDIAGFGLVRKTKIEAVIPEINQQTNIDAKNIDDIWINIGNGSVNAVDIVDIIRNENNKKINSSKNITIEIVLESRIGSLKDISRILYRNASEMFYLKALDVPKIHKSFYTVRLIVNDPQKLAYMFDEFEQVKGIISVYRIPTSKIITTKILIALTLIFWATHPLLFIYIMNSHSAQVNPTLINASVYTGLLLLFLLIMRITYLTKKYIPYIRQKALLWGFAFVTPLVIICCLIIEYYKFHTFLLNIPILVAETVFLYLYLTISYLNLKKTN